VVGHGIIKERFLKVFDDEFFKHAKQIAKEKPKEFSRAWLSLGPKDAEDEVVLKKYEDLINSCGEEDSIVKRVCKVIVDDLLRSRKALLYATSHSQK